MPQSRLALICCCFFLFSRLCLRARVCCASNAEPSKFTGVLDSPMWLAANTVAPLRPWFGDGVK